MINEAKHTLRKKLREQLRELDGEFISNASEALCQQIIKHGVITDEARYIALYAALGSEVDLSSLHGMTANKVFLYPLCHDQGVMSYHHVDSPDELRSGKYGILEPDPLLHPEIAISEVDLFFCPGIAFSRDGARLGQGAGYYDRALAQRSGIAVRPSTQTSASSLTAHHATQVPVYGVGLEQQLYDTIPTESHDVIMDAVITEQAVYITTKPH